MMQELFYKTNRSKFKATHCIVCDQRGRPMTFYGGHFCYATPYKRQRFPVEIYEEKTALELIRQSILTSNERGYTEPSYVMWPVYIGGVEIMPMKNASW